jgi:hypothetical protein
MYNMYVYTHTHTYTVEERKKYINRQREREREKETRWPTLAHHGPGCKQSHMASVYNLYTAETRGANPSLYINVYLFVISDLIYFVSPLLPRRRRENNMPLQSNGRNKKRKN